MKKLLILGILLVLPTAASAANLSISPASGSFQVGDRVTVRVMVSSSVPINAVSGIVSFPTNLFTIESVSKAGSILNFWVTEPNFNQGAGTLQFEGVTLGGYNGGTGSVVTATLRAIREGSAAVIIKSGQVLANDGQGTDVTDGTNGALYTVVATSASTPVPEKPSVVEQEIVQPKPSLDAPFIRLIKLYGNDAVEGESSYSNSRVLLTFVSPSGIKIYITGETDGDGGFSLSVPSSLKSGKYRVHAVVIKNDMSNSRESNELIVKIGNLLSDLRPEVRWGLLLLIFILIVTLIKSYQYLKRNRKLKFFMKREAREAEQALHSTFKSIRKDVDNPRIMKKDLDHAEDLIEKEIEDIEKL